MTKSSTNKNSKRITTLAGVAKSLRISETAIYAAKRRFEDFPKACARGGYSVAAFEKFAARHGLWHHRGGSASGGRGSDYSDARTEYLRERTARERVRKEIELVEQQRQVGGLVFLDDVTRITGQLVAVVIAELESFVPAIDRAMGTLSEEQRAPVLKTAERCVGNLRTAAQNILRKGDDQNGEPG
jgi:hypothetical protein